MNNESEEFTPTARKLVLKVGYISDLLHKGARKLGFGYETANRVGNFPFAVSAILAESFLFWLRLFKKVLIFLISKTEARKLS